MSVEDFLEHRPGFWTNAPQNNSNSKFRLASRYGFGWRFFHCHKFPLGQRMLDEQKTHYLLTIVNKKNPGWTAQRVVEEVQKMDEKSRENMVVHNMQPNSTALLKEITSSTESNSSGVLKI
jgi:hypothetical protein